MKKYPLINREKSIIAFQERVLCQAKDPSIPLLERLNFLSIVSSNLDEFFEVRFANIKERIFSGVQMIDDETVSAWSYDIQKRVEKIIEEQSQLYQTELLPQLDEKAHIIFLNKDGWDKEDKLWLLKYFKTVIRPLLTPIVLDVAHPFPHIYNKTLNFIIELDGLDAFGREVDIAILPIPKNLPHIVKLPGDDSVQERFSFLSEIISFYFDEIFKGLDVQGYYEFRLTRNSHLFIDKEELTNLHQTLQGELHQRNFGHAVRLELAEECPEYLTHFLLAQFDLKEIDLYRVTGVINLIRFRPLLDALANKKELFYEALIPKIPKDWQRADDYFALISQKDILFHHPFDSFIPIVNLLSAAAEDPAVQVIRMTVYRTGDDSVLMEQLVKAAQNGKEVNVVFELMARFDEATNLSWATLLEEAGVKVVYGVFGYKTHAKMLLIVRNEENRYHQSELRYYTHLSTGNYHSGTAKQYTDISLFTSNIEIAKDVSDIFLSLGSLGTPPQLRKLWQAPFNLYEQLINSIDREIEIAKSGQKAYIIGKVNALLEEKVIEKLYEASQAGVKIDLIVRGACSLKPGIEGISDNIRVRSIIGRFLEHSRIYYFYNSGEEDLFLASADWMNRNFFRRIEVAVPILDNNVKQRIITEGLLMYLDDNTNAWELDGKQGVYQKLDNDQPNFSAQLKLLKSRQ